MRLVTQEYRAVAGQHTDTVVVLLHGLLGSRRNWHGAAQLLASRPALKVGTAKPIDVLTVDLRNHGESPWNDSHTLASLADDIDVLADNVRASGRRAVFVGHSMSGVALYYAAWRHANTASLHAEHAPKIAGAFDAVAATAHVDVAPFKRPKAFYRSAEWVRRLQKIPLETLRSWADAEKAVTEATGVTDNWTVRYLLSNLERQETEELRKSTMRMPFRWQSNLDVLAGCVSDGSLLWEDGVKKAAVFGKPLRAVTRPTHVAFGEASDYYSVAAVEAVHQHFSHARVDVLPRAGHFLNIYNMREYTQLLADFLVLQDLMAKA